MFHLLPRIKTDPKVDRDWRPHELAALVFYFTVEPNEWVDIGATRERKHRALDAYQAQFTADELRLLHAGLEHKEREWAAGRGFEHGEALRVMHPRQLHVGI